MGYDDYEFPESIEAVGWIMEMLPLVIVLLYPIIPLYKVEGANKEIHILLLLLGSAHVVIKKNESPISPMFLS